MHLQQALALAVTSLRPSAACHSITQHVHMNSDQPVGTETRKLIHTLGFNADKDIEGSDVNTWPSGYLLHRRLRAVLQAAQSAQSAATAFSAVSAASAQAQAACPETRPRRAQRGAGRARCRLMCSLAQGPKGQG